MRPLSLVIGLGVLIASGSAFAATKDCASIRQKSGSAAYQKCLYDNQEETLKQQITVYRASIEKNKVSVKTSYERKINEENFTWKDIDLRLQMEEAHRQERIDLLGTSKENAEQLQIEKNALSKLKKLHSLTGSVHGNKIKRLKQRMDADVAELDQAVQIYELQLRQQDMPQL